MALRRVVTEARSCKGEWEPQGQAVFVYPGDGAHHGETKGQALLPWEMVFEACLLSSDGVAPVLVMSGYFCNFGWSEAAPQTL